VRSNTRSVLNPRGQDPFSNSLGFGTKRSGEIGLCERHVLSVRARDCVRRLDALGAPYAVAALGSQLNRRAANATAPTPQAASTSRFVGETAEENEP
jgi:hypothetical protein